MSQELLPPTLTRDQVNRVERHAQGAYGRGQQAMIQFAADVAKLQEAQAHRMRGYTNFGEYISQKFEGIQAGNAMQYARMGKVLLVLERAGRIKIDGDKEQLPSTTGIRDLATVLGKFGEDTLLAVYDRAAMSGRKVIPESIAAATQELVGPPELPALPSSETHEQTDAEIDADEDDGYSEDTSELYDRLRWLSETVDEISNELIGQHKDRAERAIAKLILEANEVKDAISEQEKEDE